MRNPHGYLRIDGGPEGLVEEDTAKCNHCQRIVSIHRGRDQFTCKQCYEPICPSCANHPCRHYEKWLEKMERGAGVVRVRLEQLEELAQKAARALGLG